MIISICDTCKRRRETKDRSPEGWEVYGCVVKCLDCRLDENRLAIEKLEAKVNGLTKEGNLVK